jgi:hypothetical protein
MNPRSPMHKASHGEMWSNVRHNVKQLFRCEEATRPAQSGAAMQRTAPVDVRLPLTVRVGTFIAGVVGRGLAFVLGIGMLLVGFILIAPGILFCMTLIGAIIGIPILLFAAWMMFLGGGLLIGAFGSHSEPAVGTPGSPTYFKVGERVRIHPAADAYKGGMTGGVISRHITKQLVAVRDASNVEHFVVPQHLLKPETTPTATVQKSA